MATENKKYIPALRFPEFQNDGEWKEYPLGQIFSRITKRNSVNNQNVLTISAQYGLISQYDYFNKNVAAIDVSNYYHISKYDFAYNKSKSQGYPYGAIKPLKLYEDGVVSPLYICFRIKDDRSFVNTFFEYYFESGLIHKEIDKISQEGARNHGLLNISTKDFFDKIILYIPSFLEQKKIADCLLSLDKYIDATKRKLELLKEHKKGLMQRLFPAKGKTTPELRFPEFQNDGEWIPRPLSDILNYEQPTPYIVEDDTYKKEGTPVLTANKGFILGYTDESFGIYNKLPVIIFDDFTTDKKYVDFSFKIKSSAMKLLTLKDEERDNLRFIFECMSNIVFEEKEHKRYYISEYQHINIYVPSSLQEQNQIADTLLSIDKQISEYDKKIKALELHKKGLMQQLFPKL